MQTYNGYTIKELTKITGYTYQVCYQYIYQRPNRTLRGLKKHKPKRAGCKLYKGMTLSEIVEKTGKGRRACYYHIHKNPGRTIQSIKEATRTVCAQKHYKDGLPLKKRCRENDMSYGTALYRVKTGKFKVDNQSIS